MVGYWSIPLVVGIVLGCLISSLAWTVLGAGGDRFPQKLMDGHDRLLTGLLTAAAFAMGAFVTYVLLI